MNMTEVISSDQIIALFLPTIDFVALGCLGVFYFKLTNVLCKKTQCYRVQEINTEATSYLTPLWQGTVVGGLL
ncbi:hypothetical protein XELAEV_18017516mg [Xenopus laevis]|uniref:Uncharacterized protein n=1 Tax=Xenopus laevis TaxID=8355 RepID=A0A974DDB2_XENLA|nr:hypothetical protein XELAEV_18017516mg [Xenopus laevis]